MSSEGTRGERWGYPMLTALLSLAANPAALWPHATYFFRDFAITFQPLHELFLKGLREGRWIFWNPYSYEGSALLPTLYPVDLLQALVPGPVAGSWLLTMHFPLAALGMYALCRELGASRPGASAAGLVYSLCGLAQSSLNLTVFLEALALAPFLALSLRRAALEAGRWIPIAALALALSLSTLAVEFVGQALLLGFGLAWVAAPRRSSLARVGAALALGMAVAALPILLTAGIVSESLRSTGSIGNLQRSVHPVGLIQVFLPNAFMSLAESIRWGWSLRIFPEAGPYFLSFYVGPLALAAAANGLAIERRLRAVLVVLAVAGLWYALGSHAGLAPLVAPLMPFLRFPVKALFLPCLSLSLLAGFGFTALGAGRGFARVVRIVGVAGLLGVAVAASATAHVGAWSAWLQFRPYSVPARLAALQRDAALAALVAVLVALVALAVARARLPAARGALLLLVLTVGQLASASWGMNPQTSPLFFKLLPELGPLVTGLEGGRVFSLGYGRSPRMAALVLGGRPGVDLFSFFLYRQGLNPFTNVIDKVELAGGEDMHGFIPNEPVLLPAAYAPDGVGHVTRVLRNAAVVRVVSLDPLDHPELVRRAEVPTGLAGSSLYVYDLTDPWPRAYVACRVTVAADRDDALGRALDPRFAANEEAVLSQPAPASCATTRVERRGFSPGAVVYEVETDAPGVLVVRDSFTPSWHATVDGRPAPVLRANGQHQAVPLGPGRHDVRLVYRPRFLAAGIAISCLGLAVAILALVRRPSIPRAGGGEPMV